MHNELCGPMVGNLASIFSILTYPFFDLLVFLSHFISFASPRHVLLLNVDYGQTRFQTLSFHRKVNFNKYMQVLGFEEV